MSPITIWALAASASSRVANAPPTTRRSCSFFPRSSSIRGTDESRRAGGPTGRPGREAATVQTVRPSARARAPATRVRLMVISVLLSVAGRVLEVHRIAPAEPPDPAVVGPDLVVTVVDGAVALPVPLLGRADVDRDPPGVRAPCGATPDRPAVVPVDAVSNVAGQMVVLDVAVDVVVEVGGRRAAELSMVDHLVPLAGVGGPPPQAVRPGVGVARLAEHVDDLVVAVRPRW